MGQRYALTFRASTASGGVQNRKLFIYRSIPIQAKLLSSKEIGLFLPKAVIGQPYYYDFVANKDVFPEYSDIPYEIVFAKDSYHPTWLTIENNRLTAKKVLSELDEVIKFYVIIKNIPGGSSQKIPIVVTLS